MKLHRVVKAMLAAALVAVCISGCSTHIKTMDITVPEQPNPAAGEIVRIVEVTDARRLEDFLGIFTFDPSIEWRALGPINSGYWVLPEGRTVADVVESSVAQGLRRAGYRVVRDGDPNSAEAVPLKVMILEFWVNREDGFSGRGGAGTYFLARITVSGPIEPFTDPLRQNLPMEITTEVKGTKEGALTEGMRKLVGDIAREAWVAEAPH